LRLPQKFSRSFVLHDQITYSRLRLPAEQSTDLRAELAPAVDLLRGRFSAMPHNTVPLILPADLTKPTGGAALMLRFLDQPATSPPPPFSSRKHLA
jgi:hypothetical protein